MFINMGNTSTLYVYNICCETALLQNPPHRQQKQFTEK